MSSPSSKQADCGLRGQANKMFYVNSYINRGWGGMSDALLTKPDEESVKRLNCTKFKQTDERTKNKC